MSDRRYRRLLAASAVGTFAMFACITVAAVVLVLGVLGAVSLLLFHVPIAAALVTYLATSLVLDAAVKEKHRREDAGEDWTLGGRLGGSR